MKRRVLYMYFQFGERAQRTLSRNFDVGHSGHSLWDTWDTLRGTLGTLWNNTWDTRCTSLGHYCDLLTIL